MSVCEQEVPGVLFGEVKAGKCFEGLERTGMVNDRKTETAQSWGKKRLCGTKA